MVKKRQATPLRSEVWLANLDPTTGSEVQKMRPCIVVSPDQMNQWIRTVIIVPMTTSQKPYPTRVAIKFDGKQGQAMLDQIRTIDKSRLIRKLGILDSDAALQISSGLVTLFRD